MDHGRLGSRRRGFVLVVPARAAPRSPPCRRWLVDRLICPTGSEPGGSYLSRTCDYADFQLVSLRLRNNDHLFVRGSSTTGAAAEFDFRPDRAAASMGA